MAAQDYAAALKDFTVVVTKSTVPVGTGDEVERLIHDANPKADFAVASNPEFLREGAAIRDFKFPDRIVIGTDDERARKVLTDVYRPLSLNQGPLMFTSRRTAELLSSTPQTLFSRPRSPSSTRSPTSPKKSAPMSRKSRAASAPTTASAQNSCMPVPDLAARASQRIRARW